MEKQRNVVFVFGSNLAGIHGAGAALYAKKYCGAKQGIGLGREGMSYAIPTKDKSIKTLPIDAIRPYVKSFLEYANNHSWEVFMVTPIGCGLAGYSVGDIKPLFFEHDVGVGYNVLFTKDWFIG